MRGLRIALRAGIGRYTTRSCLDVPLWDATDRLAIVPRARSKIRSVIAGPIEERPCWRSCGLSNGRCNEGGLADPGRPSVEQNVHDGPRHDRDQFTARLVWRNLFDAQRAADHATYCGHLLELAQRLRPGQNIFRAGVSVLTQRVDRHCG